MYEQRADRPESEQRASLVDSSTLPALGPSIDVDLTGSAGEAIFAAAFVVIAVQLAR